MYLLDTDHCSRVLAGDPAIGARLISLGFARVTTCAIVQGELMFMSERSNLRDRNLARVEAFLGRIQIHGLTSATADPYGQIKASLMAHFGPRERARARRTTIQQIGFGDNDLWIAAVAQERDLVIVSGDSDFRRMATVVDLSIETW